MTKDWESARAPRGNRRMTAGARSVWGPECDRSPAPCPPAALCPPARSC